MSLFLFFVVIYVIVGATLLPMFTRSAYKQILTARNETHPNAPNNNHRVAITQCKYNGIGRSLTWPISLPMHVSLLQITKQAEAAEQDRISKTETARILAEYNRDPIEEEFKKLEEDEKRKEQQAIKEATQKRDEHWKKKLKELEAKVDQVPKQLDFTNYNLTHNTTFSYENKEYYTSNNKKVEFPVVIPITYDEASKLLNSYAANIKWLRAQAEKTINQGKARQIDSETYEARLNQIKIAFENLKEQSELLEARIILSKKNGTFHER